jgi:hypothetical protein
MATGISMLEASNAWASLDVRVADNSSLSASLAGNASRHRAQLDCVAIRGLGSLLGSRASRVRNAIAAHDLRARGTLGDLVHCGHLVRGPH